MKTEKNFPLIKTSLISNLSNIKIYFQNCLDKKKSIKKYCPKTKYLLLFLILLGCVNDITEKGCAPIVSSKPYIEREDQEEEEEEEIEKNENYINAQEDIAILERKKRAKKLSQEDIQKSHATRAQVEIVDDE